MNPTPPLTFTVEIWFRTTTGAGGKPIGFGSSQTGSSVNADRHLYMTNAGRIVFGVNPGTVRTITSPAAYNDGAWHHAAASLSAAGIVLYLDGQGVASDATVSTAATAAGYWRIGYDNLTGCPSAPSSSYIAATLDDAAVYSTALTATKISAHHAAGR